MLSCFISYRRGDSPDTVKLIHERLKKRLPRWEIFYDHESIPLGEQFPEQLQAKVASAAVVLVIIGPKWLEILHDRQTAAIDYVQTEIGLALKATGSVVPILVGHATMPMDADLADFADIQPLLKRSGRQVRPDPDFDVDLEPIIAYLKQFDSDETVGATLADKFTLTAEIARGGMGVVYRAEQTQPVRRTVAVKLIKPGMDSRDVLARFDAERQALAVMDHPNIAKVYDAGLTAQGRPFFVMEYVKGVPITQYCDEKKLTPQDRLNLFIPVCNAVQHAHQKGIIHRDLKPSNVLVEVVDGKPIPKVIDFGLAKALGHKLTDMTLLTTLEMRIGTLEYSAPEQAAGRSFDVDTRSDIYSLGVLLYELLTGAPPFTHEELLKVGDEEMRRVIRDVEPTKPSKKLSSSSEAPTIAAKRNLEPKKLVRLVRGDLDWIVMKCLEKENRRRYQYTPELADDLKRWLNDKPVIAQRQILRYRLGKLFRKHRRKFFGSGLLALLAIMTWFILADSGYPVFGSKHFQQWLDRHEASVFRPVPSEAQLVAVAANLRRDLNQQLLKALSENDGWFAEAKEGPDPWTQMQVTVAIFSAPENDTGHSRACASVLDRIFEPNGHSEPFVLGLGWPRSVDGHCSAEASGWALSALAKVLAVTGFLLPDERERLKKRLDQVQTALDNCRSRDKQSGQPMAGWNMFAQQDDPSQLNIYITMLVCQGLLDMRQADLPWHDSRDIRDKLLTESIHAILQLFEGGGWSTPSAGGKQFNDGLTLQMFATLLAAEKMGIVKLPDPILSQIPLHLANCGNRSFDHISTVSVFFVPIRDRHGKEVRNAQRTVRSYWFPSAVSCAAFWLLRCERLGAPNDEIVRSRRVLGHLLLALGSVAIEEVRKAGYTFIIAETLIGLSSVSGISDTLWHMEP